MSALPEPLTPPDCDLRGMPYMPVDLVRLFDSDLFLLSTGAEFKAAFCLWGKAFLQVPAGSVPDDDRILAGLSGAGKQWPKLRAMALRGWIKCSDGRLYHPVVAQKAKDAWEARLAQRARTEAARAAKKAVSIKTDRNENSIHKPSPVDKNGQVVDIVKVASPVTEVVTASKGEGELSKEKKERITPPSPRKRGAVPEQEKFDQFWKLYPRKIGKGQAEKAWAKAVAARDGDPDEILMGLKVATSLDWLDMREEGRFCPHPATWLNGKRWLDRIEAEPSEPSLSLSH